jgi:seryl-tRNA synthetase
VVLRAKTPGLSQLPEIDPLEEKNKMTIIYEGYDIYTLHIGSKTLELSLDEIEEIQRFDGNKSTFELDGYIEDLEMDIDDLNDMLTRDREELKDKDEEISENMMAIYETIMNSLPQKKQNIKNVYVKLTMGSPTKIGDVQ